MMDKVDGGRAPQQRRRREGVTRELAAGVVAAMPDTTRALSGTARALGAHRAPDADAGAQLGHRERRRLQRLGYFLHQLREAADETLEVAGLAGEADGVPGSSHKTIWNLEQMMDAKVAASREIVNLLLVAYLAERWGSSLGECWSFMTAEEVGAASAAAEPSARATARDLADLYLYLAQSDPSKARQLVEFAAFITKE